MSFGATAFVPVTDQDRALEFYVRTLGFGRGTDFTYADGERWVEVLPPGGGVALSLVRERDGQSAGVEMRLALQTDDVEADHERYREAGVDVDPILREGDPPRQWSGAILGGIPPMFVLRDPDENSFLIVQRP
jgi:catechol 2,3-dioxygenase-like lactoylglutathione lyase family enzyme